VEYALRRAGIRASVEVLVDGNEPTGYHQEAMRAARQVPFSGHEQGSRPQMAPVEPVHAESFEAPRAVEPANPLVAEPAPSAPPAQAPSEPAPAQAQDSAESGSTLPPPIELRPEPAPAPAPAAEPLPAPSMKLPPREPANEPPLALPPPIELPQADAAPAPAPMPAPVPQPAPEPAKALPPAFAQERAPEDESAQPPSALSMETPTNSRPSPRRRSDGPSNEPPSRPRLVPASPPPSDSGKDSDDKHSAAFGDDILNTQERNLLRELQDELARREKQDQGSTSGAWRVDGGRHGKPGGQFDQARASGGPMMVNGVPPHHPEGRGYPPA
jgi:hypothetical protein